MHTTYYSAFSCSSKHGFFWVWILLGVMLQQQEVSTEARAEVLSELQRAALKRFPLSRLFWSKISVSSSFLVDPIGSSFFDIQSQRNMVIYVELCLVLVINQCSLSFGCF